ncbi:uncharacterized protein LOC141692470 [Apium graveolens]|uniref:uncharacterized protein LOC141692470 n=1 Tax=Apium graveolens TaxID=4045 RepID=UPI003D797828
MGRKKKCADLELEMKLKNSEFECLEDKFNDLVVENLAIKEEVGVWKEKFDELEKSVVENGNVGIGKEDVEGKLSKLMAENKVLECEKRKAESEVEVWKAKFEALELRVRELEGRDKDYNLVGKVKTEMGILETGNNEVTEVSGLRDVSSVIKCSKQLQAESAVSSDKVHSVPGLITSAQPSTEGTKNLYVSGDTLLTETPQKHLMHDECAEQSSLPGSGTGTVYAGQARKQLTYEEGIPNKKMAPSTPGGSKCAPLVVIEISESDGEQEVKILNVSTLENEDNKTVSTDPLVINLNIKESASDNKIEETFLQLNNNEDMIGDKRSSPLNATRKRRRASNIVNSDSEDENFLVSEVNVDTQPDTVTDFQSNSSPLHGTDSGNNVHKTTSKRRLMTLGNAASTPKRKGESKIVDNDKASEDEDDDVPISKLVTNVRSVPAVVLENRVLKSISRRRLASLRKIKESQLQKSSNTKRNMDTMENNYHAEILKEDDDEDASIDENESESEGESMEAFIDDRSDISEKYDSDDSLSIKSDSGNSLSRNSDHDEASDDSENISGDDINYREIMSKLRRKRDSQTPNWKFEAEMLADFGKDPVMCMKAVCALYRQQTSEEQSAKGAIYRNKRGFSHCDAYRGTSLAEFLTDGSGGELRKSVEELKQHSAKGIEECRELAKRYSKQLFAIYENKEDPYFFPNKIGD